MKKSELSLQLMHNEYYPDDSIAGTASSICCDKIMKNSDISLIVNNDNAGESVARMTDEQIMNLIYRDYSDYIYSIIIKMLKTKKINTGHADDCFGEVIIRLCDNNCRKVRQFRGESSFKTFLTVTCRNLVLDYTRKEAREQDRLRLIEDPDSFDVQGSTDDEKYIKENPEIQFLLREKESLIKEAGDIISGTIDELPDDEKILIKLRLEKKMSYREIDKFIGIDNSRYRISGILRKLRDSLDSDLKHQIESLMVEE